MDFNLPANLTADLDELDGFIAREIKPLEEADHNIRFFIYRRERARTDFEKAACRGMGRKRCCARSRTLRTPQAICASSFRALWLKDGSISGLP